MTGKQADLFGDYDLYDGDPPHQRHSATSRDAAVSIRKHIGPLHRRILGWMTEHPDGGSDERVARLLDMAQNTYRPRRIELTQMGRVKDSERRELTQAARLAVVWVLVK
jgi:hypothetical protein